MRTHRTTRFILGAVLSTLALAGILLSCLTALPSLGGFATYAVVSSSMAPQIPSGSLVIVDEHVQGEEVRIGEVIAFKKGETDESVCVHRAESIDEKGGLIETKGDANDTPDLRLVPFEDVKGTVCAHVPLAGFALMWLETHRVTFLGIIGALILASASLSFVLPTTIPSKKGTGCPNKPQSIKEA